MIKMSRRDILARLQSLQIDISKQEAEEYRDWLTSLPLDEAGRHYDKLRLFCIAELGLDLPSFLDNALEEPASVAFLDCYKALFAHSLALYYASQWAALLEHTRQSGKDHDRLDQAE